MATSKEDIKHATAQAKLSDDEMLRVAYKHGTPLESGKIADSDPVDLFAPARKITDGDRNPNGEDEASGIGAEGTKKHLDPRLRN